MTTTNIPEEQQQQQQQLQQQIKVRVPEEVLAVLRGRALEFTPRTIAGPAPPFDLMENCAFKSVLSFGAGGAMGLFFGVFLGTTSSMEVDVNAPTKQQVIQQYKAAWRQGVSMSKSFAVVGLLFSGSECLIEKARGKSDKLNSLAAGCASGALLTARAGPQAMAVGCAGFMAFSAVIDIFMHPKDVRESYSTPAAYKKLPRTMDDIDWPWYNRVFS